MPDEPNAGGETPAADQKTLDAINAAVKSHLGRLLPTAIGSALEPHMVSLREQLAPKPAPAAGAGAGGEDLATKYANLEAQFKKNENARQAERRQAREDKAFQDLRTELGGKVRPEAVDAAAKLLFHVDKKVRVADDGAVTYLHGDESLDLKSGVAEYLKSNDAKLFLPAPNPAAKGRTPPARAAVSPAAASRAEREDPLQKTLRDLNL